MSLSYWLSKQPQRSTFLRSLGIGSSLLMLSSLFLPWLVLPVQTHLPCRFPSHCLPDGVVAFQSSLWQVFTNHVPFTINQPIIYIDMIPVGVSAITLVILSSASQRHLRLARFGYMGALVVGLAVQGLITFSISTLPPLVITTVAPLSLLLVLPYLLYLFMFTGGLALFASPSYHTIQKGWIISQNR